MPFKGRMGSGLVNQELMIKFSFREVKRRMSDCVILAAGDGTRMRGEKPKPLIEFAGAPILEHVISRLATVSLSRLIIVTGYKHRYIEEFLESMKLNCAKHLEIITVVNREYERENGYSLLQVEDLIKDCFLLVMADHIVDPELYSMASTHEGLGLCVDMTPSFPSQVNDANKVLIEEGCIVRIGKELEEWNGIDTGVFSMTPIVFDALNYLGGKQNRVTLTEAVSTLIQWRQRVEVINVSGRFWSDIDTPLDLEFTERQFVLINESDNNQSHIQEDLRSVPG